MNRVFGERAMLNLPGFEGTAAIVAELSEWVVDEEAHGWEADLKISDCSRVISLAICDPSASDTDDARFENDLHKVDTMIDALKEFRKGMCRVRRMRK